MTKLPAKGGQPYRGSPSLPQLQMRAARSAAPVQPMQPRAPNPIMMQILRERQQGPKVTERQRARNKGIADQIRRELAFEDNQAAIRALYAKWGK